MKRLASLTATLALALIGAIAFVGSGCLSDGTSAVGSVGGTVGHNPETGMWTAGITITFKSYPSEKTLKLLKDAEALRVSELVFVLPKYDYRSDAHGDAVEAAQREGAALTRWKSP